MVMSPSEESGNKERGIKALNTITPTPFGLSEEEIERWGERLFRRAILRWTYDQIAEIESEETGEPVDAGRVRESVIEAAYILGIHLPDP
jgi:transposase